MIVLVGGGYYFYVQNFIKQDSAIEIEKNEVNSKTVAEEENLSEKSADEEDVADALKTLEDANKLRLTQGCSAGKDCILSIDNPKFVSAALADRDFLDNSEFVIGLERGGVKRAYPISILNWHEIVNDKVGEEYIAISFCPLCYTGNAFERVVDGEPSEFGVSGYLINSNLVMYDRKTESLWEQLTGEAIVGPKTGTKLKKITVSTMPWIDWKTLHPDTMVLSTDTGYENDYKQFPYGDYNTSNDIFFALENTDDRLMKKDLIYGVKVFDKMKAYPVSSIQEEFPNGGEFEDTVGGHSVKVKIENKRFTVYDAQTREEIISQIGFWFSWVAFYPETEVY